MLAERLLQAIEVLGSDESIKGGTMREQATAYLGEDADDDVMRYISRTSATIFRETMNQCEVQGIRQGAIPEMLSLTAVLLGGIAIGKRLGIEDGERFANSVDLT